VTRTSAPWRGGAWAERRWALHLKPFFGEFRAAQVGSELISRYVDERQTAKASNATINRELAFLKRAYQLGYNATPPKVYRVPSFPSLAEDNVRKGFLKDEEYEKLTTECAKEGLWLRALLAVAYNFGWRKSELLGLRVRQVDLLARTIHLEVGETKNDGGRTVVMTDEVLYLVSCLRSSQGAGQLRFHPRERPAGPRFSYHVDKRLRSRRRP
jgi:integrase